ncbi:MAG: nucleotidyltransferase family protein [Nanopusillaceae archaeon]
MSLDVIIMAGGFARRLKPISDFMPKPLLHIDGVPLINYVLRPVLELEYKKIIISTNEKFENSFRYWMNTQKELYKNNLPIFLSVEHSKSEEEKLGAVGGLWYTIRLYNLDIGKNDLLVILGDNLFDFDLKEFVSNGKRYQKVTIGTYNIGDKENAKKYGVVSLDKNKKVIEFVEKPEDPKSTIISVGIYYFPNEKINKIGDFIDKNKDKDAIGRLIEWLVKNDEVYSYMFFGNWFDIGTPESYIAANEWARSKNLGRRWLWP